MAKYRAVKIRPDSYGWNVQKRRILRWRNIVTGLTRAEAERSLEFYYNGGNVIYPKGARPSGPLGIRGEE